MKSKEVISTKLIQDAKQIIENARKNAVRSVDSCRVHLSVNWNFAANFSSPIQLRIQCVRN